MNTGINQDDRFTLAQELSRLLADSYFIYLKTHGYHWNVTGPMFHNLHTLFGAQYLELWNALDLIAERIRGLGHFAPYTCEKFMSLTKIRENGDMPNAKAMVEDLLQGQEILIRTARGIFPIANKAGDETTLDLVTQRLIVHEKNAWMLRSILVI
jgi:starvation-inducible DNA-binding protein